MLGRGQGARAYQHPVMLTRATATKDWAGHAKMGTPEDVLLVYASVQQMSASKSLMTFQQQDVVGLDIEFRNPCVEFNGLRWRGHTVHFAQPEDVDSRGRILRIQGWYQIDDPVMEQGSEN